MNSDLKDMDSIGVSTTGWHFDNTYSQLPPAFYRSQNATLVREPRMAVFNHALAESLGLDAKRLAEENGKFIFSGNETPVGSEPLAQAYAGHQFGNFTMLGDGRALLLGEHIAPDGARFDIQLKGSGQTPYSRRGDGKAALGPMLREYLISESMHALAIPTTRSLAVVTTGEPVMRDAVLPGAVLTRVASSHIRVGTFQFAYAIDDAAALKALADYTINRHYPELATAENPYLALLYGAMDRQAALIAKWMHVGFIHGVMNTDNMTISGETIDYGPCAFMDAYDPATVFSSIDQQGRYAFGNQPPIAQWNLARFAETLLPLLHADIEEAVHLAEEALHAFPQKYEAAWLAGMRAKLGLLDEAADDAALSNELLACMLQHGMDYTNTFRALATEQSIHSSEPDVQAWLARWRGRLNSQSVSREAAIATMRSANPAVIPRNHLVEAALSAAVEDNDFAPFEKLLAVLASPFEETPENVEYRMPAPPSRWPYQTFCGT
ncbi:MAG: YdiU family protein [Methylophilaceae bacterium]